MDRWQCLFYATSESRKKYKTSIIPFLLNAAKVFILNNWKSKKLSTMSEWFREVNRTRLMEELLYLRNNSFSMFYDIWRCWLEFKQSLVYTRHVGNENISEEGREGSGKESPYYVKKTEVWKWNKASLGTHLSPPPFFHLSPHCFLYGMGIMGGRI